MKAKDILAYEEAREIALAALRLASNGNQYVDQQKSNAELARAAAEMMKACKASSLP